MNTTMRDEIESESCVDERVCCCPCLLYIETGSQIEGSRYNTRFEGEAGVGSKNQSS